MHACQRNPSYFPQRTKRAQQIPKNFFFEGEGDVLKAGDTWFGGYYFRSDPQAHAAVSEILREQILPLRLTDGRFYHLDTCFCPLGDSVIYFLEAFDEYSLKVIRYSLSGNRMLNP